MIFIQHYCSLGVTSNTKMSSTYGCMILWVMEDLEYLYLYIWSVFIFAGIMLISNSLMILGIWQTNKMFNISDKLYILLGTSDIGYALSSFLTCIFIVLKLEISLESCPSVNKCLLCTLTVVCYTIVLVLLGISCTNYVVITKPLQSKNIFHRYCGSFKKQLLWLVGYLSFSLGISVVPATLNFLYVKSTAIVVYTCPIVFVFISIVINLYLVYYLKRYPAQNQQVVERNQKVMKLLLVIITLEFLVTLLAFLLLQSVFYTLETGDEVLMRKVIYGAMLFHLIDLLSLGVYPIFFIVRQEKVFLFYKKTWSCFKKTQSEEQPRGRDHTNSKIRKWLPKTKIITPERLNDTEYVKTVELPVSKNCILRIFYNIMIIQLIVQRRCSRYCDFGVAIRADMWFSSVMFYLIFC